MIRHRCDLQNEMFFRSGAGVRQGNARGNFYLVEPHLAVGTGIEDNPPTVPGKHGVRIELPIFLLGIAVLFLGTDGTRFPCSAIMQQNRNIRQNAVHNDH